jgi:hypothetical protein
MKVNSLQLFLSSLRFAVTAADDGSPISADLDTVCAGLEPFAPLDVGQFAAFLRQAEQYRNSGAVSVPSPASLGAEEVQAGLRRAASLTEKMSSADDVDERELTDEWGEARDELKQALVAFLKPLSITVTLKGAKKKFQGALNKARKEARARAFADQIRAALDGVTDETTLQDLQRQEELRGILEELQLAELKDVAVELGMARPTARTPDAILTAIVTRVTGIKPATRRAARTSRTSGIDQAAVEQQAVKLKGLVEKSRHPGGLSNAEIEAALDDLQPMSVAELQAVAREIGLSKPGRTKAGALKAIRDKLREAERARESIQV